MLLPVRGWRHSTLSTCPQEDKPADYAKVQGRLQCAEVLEANPARSSKTSAKCRHLSAHARTKSRTSAANFRTMSASLDELVRTLMGITRMTHTLTNQFWKFWRD